MDDIVERMRREREDLARKLRAVDAFLAAYDAGDVAAQTTGSPHSRQKTNSRMSREKVGVDGFGEYGRGIVANAMKRLLESPHPARTREIVDYIESIGIEISGENKINAVGAMLARSADIVSHGKKGWTVADEAVAREIVGKYAQKEKEPNSGYAVGSDAGKDDAPTSPFHRINL